MSCRGKTSISYEAIKNDCAITTAASSEFAPALLNLLSSLKANFPSHPKIYFFDLGLSRSQLAELRGMDAVKICPVPRFAAFWNLCWSWKPVIWTIPEERYVLHLDAGTLVLRPLELLFLSIKRHGYLALSQGQALKDISPPDLLDRFGIDASAIDGAEVVAAGVFGFDAASRAGAVVRETAAGAREGLALGWSAAEMGRAKSHLDRIERRCPVFRHDQTILSLLLRKEFGASLQIRNQRKYLGFKSTKDHPTQFLWHARRHPRSMLYLTQRVTRRLDAFAWNRCEYFLRTTYGKIKKQFR